MENHKKKVGRPHLDPSLRKHPHKPRKSTTRGEQYDVPEPSKEEKKHWEWLVELAEATVLSMPATSYHIEKKLMLRLWHPPGVTPPKGWPRGKAIKTDALGNVLRSLNCELVLLWLWQMKLAPNNPSMLYAMRRKHWANAEREIKDVLDIEKCLDISLDIEQNVDIEIKDEE